MFGVHLVCALAIQRPDLDAGVVPDLEVGVDVDAAQVELGMMIGAQAQNVVGGVWSLVRLTEPPDVGAFRVHAYGNRELDVADLAGVLVQLLDGVRDLRAAHDALGNSLRASRASGSRPAS